MLNPHAATLLAYHERTKHRLERYAFGPETLDWDAQPDPFRRFAGAPLTPLPLPANDEKVAWSRIFTPGAIAPHPATLRSIGLLFELSFALSAWKQLGPDRWAQRCNPSSGNLHPTEVYLLASGLAYLDDGLYHYAPREHALEQRAALTPPIPPIPQESSAPPRLLVGFSSIHWREAWKYGERAFRYCQLDMGHAIGALRYAAAVLGWRLREVALTHDDIARLLGLDRASDFARAEREEPEAVFELLLTPGNLEGCDPLAWLPGAAWQGQANRLDPRPMYHWPVIEQAAQASRRSVPTPAASGLPMAARRLLPNTQTSAADLIRSRRSAQRFDRRARLDAERLWPMLEALMPQTEDGHAALPWDTGNRLPAVHAVLFAHRIDGLAPGAYLLARHPSALPALQAALAHLAWQQVPNSPPGVPLHELVQNPALAGTLRTLSCHQAIAADALFVVALLAEFTPRIGPAPWQYRELLREAGLIGQSLYLEAEAAGLRGTGIGCYFDDPVHELLGLSGPAPQTWQVLYHFSVGLPMPDERITRFPPYDRQETMDSSAHLRPPTPRAAP
ncbi:nitroreductase family protein [Polaromonas hydrogenivorans]|uniref:Nitroreductase family protein n=1 Tax=Polaromonas hydrogenivorans TaxID=335476 RepID=A0AAU7LW72_9BURK